MIGKRTLFLALALGSVLAVGWVGGPVLYRIAFLNPRLDAALRTPDLNEVERLVDLGADANYAARLPGWLTLTPLERAVDQGGPDDVRRLLKRGAHPDLRLYSGQTALMRAAASGDPAKVRLLLQAGSDANARDDDNNTPIMHAVSVQRADSSAEGAQIVRLLASAGADVNARGSNDRTVLMQAITGGGFRRDGKRIYQSTTTLEALLALKADPSLRTTDGDTVRSLAEEAGERELVRCLRHVGAPGLYEQYAGAPEAGFFIAIRTNDHGAVKRMLRNGAHLAVQDRRGLSPLMYAAALPDGTLLHYILRHGSDVKAALELRDPEGATALFRATAYEYGFKELLDAGADPNTTNNQGWALYNMLLPKQQEQLLTAGGRRPQ